MLALLLVPALVPVAASPTARDATARTKTGDAIAGTKAVDSTAAVTARAKSGEPWANDPAAVMQSVLAQPVYRSAPATTTQAPKKTLWDEFWDWLVKLFRSVFGPVARAVSATSGAGTVIGVGLTIAAVLGLAFVIVRFVIALTKPAGRAAGTVTGRALALRRSTGEWRGIASEYAARNDYARAIAALFAAALAALDERALVPFDASRTPGEYRRLVRRAKANAAPPFDDLTSGFVRAAYSDEPAERGDFENAQRALAAFEPLVAAP